MKNFTFLISFILLLLATPSFSMTNPVPSLDTTRITMKWLPGKNPNELNILWSVNTPGQNPSVFRVETWYHVGQVMNFNIRISPETQELTFLYHDRAATHPDPRQTLLFKTTLPGNPVFFFATDLDESAATRMFPGNGVSSLGAVYQFGGDSTEDFFLSGVTTATLRGRVNFNIATSTVVTPEPGTAVLMFLGLVGLVSVGGKNNGSYSRDL